MISNPMFLAVPSMILLAASRSLALRSGSLSRAMSSICFAVTLPTFSLLGAPEPLAMPAAFFSR